jgi:hypothetical protein
MTHDVESLMGGHSFITKLQSLPAVDDLLENGM